MAFTCCNFLGYEDFNDYINVVYAEDMCDSTYLGNIEIPVELSDEDDRFFGTRIREAIKVFKECFYRKK